MTNGAVVSTMAGSTTFGSTNGTGSAASFSFPIGVAVDSSGNVCVGDSTNNLIREISPGGVVTTLAGSIWGGSSNGTGTAALFYGPDGVAVDGSGNVYVADFGNNLIRKIAPGAVVTTLAGSMAYGSSNGVGTAASFNGPQGVAVDASGNVYVADRYNNMIRVITSGGLVSTLAGTSSPGSANGTGTGASFYWPQGVAVDGAGNVYVGDSLNNLIRKITPGGMVSTLAGQAGVTGATNATGTAATFNYPIGVAVDDSGTVYVADCGNNMIRKITPGGVVSTLAGSTTPGSSNGTGTGASFKGPFGVAVGNTGIVYVADSGNNMIREIQ